jgi:methyltransferase-like protein
LHYTDLCKKIAARSDVKDLEQIKNHLNNDLNLMRAVFAGLISISSYPGNYILDIRDKPYTTTLARYQIKRQNFVTNQRHEPIALDPLTKLLLPYIHGKYDIATLAKIVKKEIEKGKLKVQDEKQQPLTKAQLDQRLGALCRGALDNLAKQALLVHHSKG